MTAVRSSPPQVADEPVAVTPSPGRHAPGVAAYDSVTFELASRFLQARAGTGPAPRRPWFLDARGLVALVRLVSAEPVLDVALTWSTTGRRLRAAMSGRTWGVPRNRLCVAVLTVPHHVPERPSGNRNRALRAALNAADRSGVSVRSVAEPAERARVAAAAAGLSPRLESWAAEAADHPDDHWWVAEGPHGELAGVVVAVVDDRWASLVTLIGFGDARQSSTARFVLHHALTRVLAARGVERLAVLDDSPLLVGAGTRHLQRVLGYELARLRRPSVAAPAAITTR